MPPAELVYVYQIVDVFLDQHIVADADPIDNVVFDDYQVQASVGGPLREVENSRGQVVTD